jgi:predicted dehydrogenase
MMHLPTLAERPDLFTIVALAEVDRRRLHAVGRRYRVETLAADFRDWLPRPDLEAVLILSPGSHEEAVIAALRAGKHVFVEKPLGFSPRGVEEVARVARRSPGRLMIGYHKRFDPAYLRARAEVRRLRGLRFVEVAVLHPDDAAYRTHHAILPTRPWSAAPEEVMDRGARAEALSGPLAAAIAATAGKGASEAARVATSMLFQSLIHDINAVRGLLGEPAEVLSAHAWRGGMAQTSLTRFPGDVRVLLNWISVPGLKHYEETLRLVAPDRRVTLVFPSPYLRHAPTPLVVERAEGDELVVEHRTVSYEEAFRAELMEFRRCVLQGRDPSPGLPDARGDARWIQAIARAYR